jgi:quercetin dioxygenase-like cupin family protein
MSNYITTHNSEGKAIFSDASGSRTKLDTPIGSMEVLYTTHSVPTNVASEADIDQYSQDAKGALGNRLCPENGTAAAVLDISPNSESPFHRTMTLDMFLVIEGDLELTLDSGEKRTLHAGDCVTQR